jgi:hypothetical protein
MKTTRCWPLWHTVLLFGSAAFVAIVFILTLLVHITTYLMSDPLRSLRGVRSLDYFVFVALFAACYWGNTFQRVRGQALKPPRWLYCVIVAFAANFAANFVVNWVCSGGAVASKDDGFALVSHGRVVRKLTEQEYHQQIASDMRTLSAIWMTLALVSTSVLWGIIIAGRKGDPWWLRLPQGAPPEKSEENGIGSISTG